MERCEYCGAPLCSKDCNYCGHLHNVVKVKTNFVNEEKHITSTTIEDYFKGISCMGYYLKNTLSLKKLNNIKKFFPISEKEDILASIDTTLFGTHKYGLVFGRKGIYINNNTWGGEKFQVTISYDEFSTMKITFDKHNIIIGDHFVVSLAGCMMNPKAVQKFLLGLKDILTIVPVLEYWLAKNKQASGPFTLEAIQEKIAAQEIDPLTDYIWKEGLENWILVSKYEAFKKELPSKLPPLPF